MNEKQCDYIFKFILIGNGNSGKTSLLYYFQHAARKKNPNVKQTLGVEFSSKEVVLKQKTIKLQLWDTAGQERYRALTKVYYRGALGALIVYDVTNTESFEAIGDWIKFAREYSKPSIQIIIVANKVDLAEERVVSTQQGEQFCQENDVLYIETSAKTGLQVNEAFNQITLRILDRVQNGEVDGEAIKPKFLTSKSKDNVNNKVLEQSNCNC